MTAAMHLLDLPSEIIHEILVIAVIERGTKDGKYLKRGARRGLRLRLVNKIFSHMIKPALFASGLLDHCYALTDGYQWYIHDQKRSSHYFWHSYLVYRVNQESDPEVGRFVHIRLIAETLVSDSDLSYGAVTDGLCWLALESATAGRCSDPAAWGFARPRLGFWDGRNYSLQRLHTSRVTSSDVLSAATYFDLRPLVERLLVEGADPNCHNYLFRPAIEVAAWKGNTDLIRRFITAGPVTIRPFADNRHLRVPGSGFLNSTAAGGHLDTLQLVFFGVPLVKAKIKLSERGDVMPVEIDTSLIKGALTYARNPGVFKWLQQLLSTPLSRDELAFHLFNNAFRGNLEMVNYLLEIGTLPEIPVANWQRLPLVAACRQGHNAVVDVLLKHGANINLAGSKDLTALIAAAAAGNLPIVRKLIDNGADVNRRWKKVYTALFFAFALEHTPMIELLISKGAKLDGDVGSCILQMALSRELSSMVNMLHQFGVHNPAEIERPEWLWWDHVWDPDLTETQVTARAVFWFWTSG